MLKIARGYVNFFKAFGLTPPYLPKTVNFVPKRELSVPKGIFFCTHMLGYCTALTPIQVIYNVILIAHRCQCGITVVKKHHPSSQLWREVLVCIYCYCKLNTYCVRRMGEARSFPSEFPSSIRPIPQWWHRPVERSLYAMV